MSEGFWQGWGRHLFDWYGFTFTVVGAAVGLYLAREHWWVSVLIVIATTAASTAFAWQRHEERALAERRCRDQVAEEAKLRAEAVKLAEEAQRKLAETPYRILVEIERIVLASSYHQLGHELAEKTDLAARMLKMFKDDDRAITVRQIVTHGPDIFAVAKVPPGTAIHVRVGDPFILYRKVDTASVETEFARLTVHQPSDEEKDVVVFRIDGPLGENATWLGGLPSLSLKIKGLLIKPAIDVTRFVDCDFANLALAIRSLLQDGYKTELGK